MIKILVLTVEFSLASLYFSKILKISEFNEKKKIDHLFFSLGHEQ